MTRPNRTVQLLAVSAVAALVLSACGSDDSNGGTAAEPTRLPRRRPRRLPPAMEC